MLGGGGGGGGVAGYPCQTISYSIVHKRTSERGMANHPIHSPGSATAVPGQLIRSDNYMFRGPIKIMENN